VFIWKQRKWRRVDEKEYSEKSMAVYNCKIEVQDMISLGTSGILGLQIQKYYIIIQHWLCYRSDVNPYLGLMN
jgi:hypothetical protein